MVFDYIIAQSIFSHATRKQVSRTLETAFKTMHGSSVFVFDYVLGAKNNEAKEWVYPGNVTYTRAWMRLQVEAHAMGYAELVIPQVPATMVWVAATPLV